MCRLINAIVYATIGYCMQVIIFPHTWLHKVENIVHEALAKFTKIYQRNIHVWSIAANLKPLLQLNFERYINSLWCNMQIMGPSIAENNIMACLIKDPKTIPLLNNNRWTEPQDALYLLGLNWTHTNNVRIPPITSPPTPPLPLPDPTALSTQVWTDRSLQRKLNRIAASSITTGSHATAWPIHGSLSSTKAEIQAIIGTMVTYPLSRNLIIYSDSKAAINAINKAYQNQHTNLHNMPNHVSLRILNHINNNQKIIITPEKKISTSVPIIQLIQYCQPQ